MALVRVKGAEQKPTGHQRKGTRRQKQAKQGHRSSSWRCSPAAKKQMPFSWRNMMLFTWGIFIMQEEAGPVTSDKQWYIRNLTDSFLLNSYLCCLPSSISRLYQVACSFPSMKHTSYTHTPLSPKLNLGKQFAHPMLKPYYFHSYPSILPSDCFLSTILLWATFKT